MHHKTISDITDTLVTDALCQVFVLRHKTSSVLSYNLFQTSGTISARGGAVNTRLKMLVSVDPFFVKMALWKVWEQNSRNEIVERR